MTRGGFLGLQAPNLGSALYAKSEESASASISGSGSGIAPTGAVQASPPNLPPVIANQAPEGNRMALQLTPPVLKREGSLGLQLRNKPNYVGT